MGIRSQTLSQAEPRIVGPSLQLTDVRSLCASAGFCHRGDGIWNLTRQSDAPEKRDLAIKEAQQCPSGRLVIADEEGIAMEPDLEPSIGLVEDLSGRARGPLWVRGGIPIVSADGHQYEARNRVTLCRCGLSVNKPLCDGSHRLDVEPEQER